MAQIEKLMDEIKGMTVLELNQLVKALEDEFGVSAAAAAVPVMVTAQCPGPPPVSRRRSRPSSTSS